MSVVKSYKKLRFDKSMLGKKCAVKTNDRAVHRGFESGVIYHGALLEKTDWMVGCPVFNHELGMLGLGYDCALVDVER